MDYKKAYFSLFNEVTDIITLLQKAQLKCEEIIISDEKNQLEN